MPKAAAPRRARHTAAASPAAARAKPTSQHTSQPTRTSSSPPAPSPRAPSPRAGPLTTPDDRYIVVKDTLWRRTNPSLPEPTRQALVADLMAARRDVGVRQRAGAPAAAVREARARVDAAKVGLGERGDVWWADGAPDWNRKKVKNTPYAAWYAGLGGREGSGKGEAGEGGEGGERPVRRSTRAAARKS